MDAPARVVSWAALQRPPAPVNVCRKVNLARPPSFQFNTPPKRLQCPQSLLLLLRLQ
jgi:hypothetical protein